MFESVTVLVHFSVYQLTLHSLMHDIPSTPLCPAQTAFQTVCAPVFCLAKSQLNCYILP